MLFLIEYERRRGRLISIQRFDESEQRRAEGARLELELENNGDLEREVVLLDADSEESLRRTHRRYFADLSELVKAS